MPGRILILTGVVGLTLLGTARGLAPANGTVTHNNISTTLIQAQRSLLNRFVAFKQELLEVKRRQENSFWKDRALLRSVTNALTRIDEAGIESKAVRLLKFLEERRLPEGASAEQAFRRSRTLEKELWAVCYILSEDHCAARLRAEQSALATGVRQLGELIVRHQKVRILAATGKVAAAELRLKQLTVNRQAEWLLYRMSRAARKASKPILRAVDSLHRVNALLARNRLPDAIKSQGQAARELEKARVILGDLQKDNYADRLAHARKLMEYGCHKIVKMQRSVLASTRALDRVLQSIKRLLNVENINAWLIPAHRQEAIKRARLERLIVGEFNQLISDLRMNEDPDGVEEVFTEIREDAREVQQRLAKAKVGSITQGIEQDIIDELQRMIRLLKGRQSLRRSKTSAYSIGEHTPNKELARLLS